jgi:hypothetical protein
MNRQGRTFILFMILRRRRRFNIALPLFGLDQHSSEHFISTGHLLFWGLTSIYSQTDGQCRPLAAIPPTRPGEFQKLANVRTKIDNLQGILKIINH